MTTLPTLLESTPLEWYLAEKAKILEDLKNAKMCKEVKEMLLARFVPKHQNFLDSIALMKVRQETGLEKQWTVGVRRSGLP